MKTKQITLARTIWWWWCCESWKKSAFKQGLCIDVYISAKHFSSASSSAWLGYSFVFIGGHVYACGIARSFWLGSLGNWPSYRKFFGSARTASVNEPAWRRRYFWNSRKTYNGPKWRMAKFVGKNIRQRRQYRIFFFLAFVLFFLSFSLSYNVTAFPPLPRARADAALRRHTQRALLLLPLPRGWPQNENKVHCLGGNVYLFILTVCGPSSFYIWEDMCNYK